MTISRLTASIALLTTTTFAVGSAPNHATTYAKRTIVVRMLGDGSGFRYSPATISAHGGDVLRFVNVSGGPHNVSFWEDSIPAGTAATLRRNMQKTTDGLNGELLTEPNETFTVSLAGLRAGTYRFYCLPHLPMKMVGRIKLRP